MRDRLSVLMSGVLSPRRVAAVTGRLPFRQCTLDSVGARELSLPPSFSRDRGERILDIPQAVLSGTGAVLDSRFRIVRDACSLSSRTDAPWDRARAVGLVPSGWQPVQDVRVCTTTVASIVTSTQKYYFHWLFDVLPRIAMLRALGREPDAWYADVSREFQRETLATLGLELSCVIAAADVPTLAPDRALIPQHRIGVGQPFPRWVVEFLRTTLGAAEADGSARRLLWISRRDATFRTLVNEAEILEQLRPLGVVDVSLSELSIAEQARLFAEAALIVAPHGSGLANLVFASPGARVLELLPARSIDLYARLAAAVGCEHVAINGEGVGPEPNPNREVHVRCDLVLDRVRGLLEGL